MNLKKIIISLSILLLSSSLPAKEELIFAIDVVRHGDRTPQVMMPKSPYTWKEGVGQLTPLGMQQMFKLGTSLRKKYIDSYKLLPKHYQNNTMLVFSTDIYRTLMSAQSLLLGLYPLGTGPSLKNGKPALPNAFQPIPIHSQALFKNPENEKRCQQLYIDAATSALEQKTTTIQLKNNLKKWGLATGVNLNKSYKLAGLADAIRIHKLHSIPLPPKLSDKDTKEIIELGEKMILGSFNRTKMADCLVKNSMTNGILTYLQDAKKQKTPLKYVLFSSHDTMIGLIMTLLGKPLKKLPPYASDLNFELFKTDAEKYIVKINYNGKPVFLPGCKKQNCTLEQFTKIINN